jgi:hypothetical protein
VTYALQPAAGDALVFNSKITHDGGEGRSVSKYMMRSEVMYRPRAEHLGEEPSRGAGRGASRGVSGASTWLHHCRSAV